MYSLGSRILARVLSQCRDVKYEFLLSSRDIFNRFTCFLFYFYFFAFIFRWETIRSTLHCILGCTTWLHAPWLLAWINLATWVEGSIEIAWNKVEKFYCEWKNYQLDSRIFRYLFMMSIFLYDKILIKILINI